MDKWYKHVFCTDCRHGYWVKIMWEDIERSHQRTKPYSESRIEPQVDEYLPDACRNCYHYEPEDSRSRFLRFNYKPSLRGFINVLGDDLHQFFHWQLRYWWFKITGKSK